MEASAMNADSEKIARTPKDAKLGPTRRIISIDVLVLTMVLAAMAWWVSSAFSLYSAVVGAAVAVASVVFYGLTLRRLFALRWPDRFEWKCPDCGGAVASRAFLEESLTCCQCS